MKRLRWKKVKKKSVKIDKKSIKFIVPSIGINLKDMHLYSRSLPGPRGRAALRSGSAGRDAAPDAAPGPARHCAEAAAHRTAQPRGRVPEGPRTLSAQVSGATLAVSRVVPLSSDPRIVEFHRPSESNTTHRTVTSKRISK